MTPRQHDIALEVCALIEPVLQGARSERTPQRLDALIDAIIFKRQLEDAPGLDLLCDNLISDLDLYLSSTAIVRLDDIRVEYDALRRWMAENPWR